MDAVAPDRLIEGDGTAETSWRGWLAAAARPEKSLSQLLPVNARLVVVSLNNGHQVALETEPAPDANAGTDGSVTESDGAKWDYPDQRLTEFAKTHGFELILLTPPMRALARQNQAHFHGFANTRLGTGHCKLRCSQTWRQF